MAKDVNYLPLSSSVTLRFLSLSGLWLRSPLFVAVNSPFVELEIDDSIGEIEFELDIFLMICTMFIQIRYMDNVGFQKWYK